MVLPGIVDDMHDAAKSFLSQHVELIDPYDDRIVCFHAHADGSADKVIEDAVCPAAWAVVITAELGDGSIAMVGVFGSQVVKSSEAVYFQCLGNECSNFIGSTLDRSDMAEWSGVFWAMIWRLQALSKLPFVVHGDGTVQLYAAGGGQTWKSELVANLLRSIAILLQQHCHTSVCPCQRTLR